MRKPSPELNDFTDERSLDAHLLEFSAALGHEIRALFPNHKPDSPDTIFDILRSFYSQNHPFCELLSASIISQTLAELQLARSNEFYQPPAITYVTPIHNCNPDLIQLTVNSLRTQIGVTCRAIFIIDGHSAEDLNALQQAIEKHAEGLDHKIIVKEKNAGVAKARNTGMAHIESEFFSWIDANDMIHPLRSLHAILLLINNPIKRVNTSYSRVHLASKKAVVRNMKFFHTGHTSFVAYTFLLQEYGYLADLRYHEDTEYQQRLEFFNVPMMDTDVVGHYLDIQFGSQSHLHLSGNTWDSAEAIENHPFLGGTYSGQATRERLAINAHYQETYEELRSEAFAKYFPCLQ